MLASHISNSLIPGCTTSNSSPSDEFGPQPSLGDLTGLWFLASVWPTPCCSNHLGMESVDEDCPLWLSLSLCCCLCLPLFLCNSVKSLKMNKICYFIVLLIFLCLLFPTLCLLCVKFAVYFPGFVIKWWLKIINLWLLSGLDVQCRDFPQALQWSHSIKPST